MLKGSQKIWELHVSWVEGTEWGSINFALFCYFCPNFETVCGYSFNKKYISWKNQWSWWGATLNVLFLRHFPMISNCLYEFYLYLSGDFLLVILQRCLLWFVVAIAGCGSALRQKILTLTTIDNVTMTMFGLSIGVPIFHLHRLRLK